MIAFGHKGAGLIRVALSSETTSVAASRCRDVHFVALYSPTGYLLLHTTLVLLEEFVLGVDVRSVCDRFVLTILAGGDACGRARQRRVEFGFEEEGDGNALPGRVNDTVARRAKVVVQDSLQPAANVHDVPAVDNGNIHPG